MRLIFVDLFFLAKNWCGGILTSKVLMFLEKPSCAQNYGRARRKNEINTGNAAHADSYDCAYLS